MEQSVASLVNDYTREPVRIAPDDDFCPTRFLRRHVARNAVHSPVHIRKRELLGHHRPPSRCAKLDLRCHHPPRMLRA